MKIVAVTRTRNEADIIECFVRHHAAMVDHHVVVGNNCSDATQAILRALHAEGVAVGLLENDAVQFVEAAQNTFLLTVAATHFGADWVVYLDSDEFIDPRGLRGSLREHLEGVPDAVEGIKVPMVNYIHAAADDPAEPNVVQRMQHRWRDKHDVHKVMVRGRLAGRNTTVYAGNHLVLVDGVELALPVEPALVLAHYPKRSPWQEVAKLVIGRLRAESAGAASAGFAAHYVEPFAALKENPMLLFGDPDFYAQQVVDERFVRDPLPYLGGALAHTAMVDAKYAALGSVVAYAERLAKQLGHLQDSNAGVRAQVDAMNMTYRQVF